MNILVPTDFSEVSKYALEAAASIARSTGATITLFNVIKKEYEMKSRDIIAGDVSMMLNHKYMAAISEESRTKLRSLGEQYGDVQLEMILHKMRYDELPEAIANKTTDLIVMGTEGSNSVGDYLAGTNTETVVRKANAPVMVVDHAVKSGYSIRKMVCPVDLSQDNEKVVGSLKTFGRLFNAEIHLLCVCTSKADYEGCDARLAQFASKMNLDYAHTHSVIDDDIDDGIVKFAESAGADLIVMPTHARSGMALMFQGSVTQDVIEKTRIPVLTFKFKGKA